MAEHLATGSWGEKTAAGYLESKGYTIHKANYRYNHSEIDLIASKDDLLLFVEVKTRRGTGYGMPETFVNLTKVRLVKKAAEHYIFASDWVFDVRFDIIAIVLDPDGGYEVHHFEDAFC